MRTWHMMIIPILALASGSAHAEASGNVLTLDMLDQAANVARVEIDGSGNTLTIAQDATVATGVSNRITVSITGNDNGGAQSGTLAPAPLISGLPWGSLSQTGEGNSMDVRVNGSANLLAAAQSGSANMLLASVAGSSNLAAVSQSGTGNVAVFSQAGQGNTMSITQRSW